MFFPPGALSGPIPPIAYSISPFPLATFFAARLADIFLDTPFLGDEGAGFLGCLAGFPFPVPGPSEPFPIVPIVMSPIFFLPSLLGVSFLEV